ncbi:MAG: MATE family efflux transporter [Clostridiales bacterium]|nr:MATE family efflux transporter [Clostridiales bacterium]
MKAVNTENRMGTEPIPKLLFTMAFPLIISMLVQAFYNIVDSLYVSQLNQAAFNAVSLSYPIQNIMSAIASGTGIGLVSLISRSLGEKNYQRADTLANNGVFLALCSYLVMVLFAFVGLDAFFFAQTDIPEIIKGGKAYLTICCVFSFGQFGQVVFERLLQSVGKSHFSMWILLTGAILNIILDPVLIFGWGPFPQMGVAGAATATVTGQICSMIVGIILNLRYNQDIRLHFKHFRPDGRIILSIYKIGVPSMLTIGIGSVMTFMMNRLLLAIESTATAAAVFGAYFKIQSFFNMPVIGLSHGMNPIIGYNLGAGDKKRMLKTYRLSLSWSFIYMFIGTLAFIFIPGTLLGIFNASPQMLEIGIPAFRIIAIAFTISAYSLVTSQFFMACGKSFLALFMSIARQLVVLIPMAYLLGYTFGYSYVWFALPVGELGSVAMAIYGRIHIKRNILDKMK